MTDAKLEITQTSKMRKKEDLLHAFEPIIAEATAIACKGSPQDIQGKVRRVVEVWRARQIFSQATQVEVEKAIDGMECLAWESVRQNWANTGIQRLIDPSLHVNLLSVDRSSQAPRFPQSSHRWPHWRQPCRKPSSLRNHMSHQRTKTMKNGQTLMLRSCHRQCRRQHSQLW